LGEWERLAVLDGQAGSRLVGVAGFDEVIAKLVVGGIEFHSRRLPILDGIGIVANLLYLDASASASAHDAQQQKQNFTATHRYLLERTLVNAHFDDFAINLGNDFQLTENFEGLDPVQTIYNLISMSSRPPQQNWNHLAVCPHRLYGVG